MAVTWLAAPKSKSTHEQLPFVTRPLSFAATTTYKKYVHIDIYRHIHGVYVYGGEGAAVSPCYRRHLDTVRMTLHLMIAVVVVAVVARDS